MVDYLIEATKRPWMSIYLRILAFVFAYGAIVHFSNIAGFGEIPWLETPLTWRIGDVFYGIVDTAAVIGLWQRQVWGIGLCLVGILSQFIIYTVFIDYFAFTPDQRQTIYGLLGTEAILVLILTTLLLLKK
ncbi:hypothetical protein BJP34_02840 [Moorena producens PAL-8-15-08-1]|uniref:DoxX family protein n=1 Tax=Moorena producens PAL-8-15-08-1 TaxID=1458985 RepID=A0A1D8TLM8_9CYAN|nr:hypothetical protein [Moorena producens]AOW98519.1 hypothetical protein BJP34_02840 [Moorena producens PAL-8-15-08-1]